MMPAPKTRRRCAIYTRVSTDAGLEQEFNSLDNQREASEAYIKSQAHEGWQCLPDSYDDGRFSGGSLERPALARLLADIHAAKIDIVVVYKVDRLTRSLADFAKLVELFDQQGISFVSVTQAFNTTTSMGRLTLNVLLSFAQFEREVTAERIRDKIAASKKKGLRMGGPVPLGYRAENKRLVIEESEAESVRTIFRRYLELRSLDRLLVDLRMRRIRTKVTQLKDGRVRGGIDFCRSGLAYLLRNRVYIGEIIHKGQHYPGDHEPLIDPALFAAVQEQLSVASPPGRRRRRIPALLCGRINDDRGHRMTPVSSVKGAIRHRYYASCVLFQGRKHEAGSIHRVSAPDIEAQVLNALRAHPPAQALNPDGTASERDLVDAFLIRITVHPGRLELLLGPEDAPSSIILPWMPRSNRRQRGLHRPTDGVASSPRMRSETRARLIDGIARARYWLDELLSGTVSSTAEIAARHNLSERSVRQLLNLAFLSPAIVRSAIEGTLPPDAGISKLTGMPMSWNEQEEIVGLS